MIHYKGFVIIEDQDGVSFSHPFDKRFFAQNIVEAKDQIDQMHKAWEALRREDLELYERERKA